MIDNMRIKQVSNDAKSLLNTVVNGGYCIGCGACASVEGSPIRMRLDEYGRYQASLDPSWDMSQSQTPVGSVCPFSDQSLSEDQLGKRLFSSRAMYDDKLGYVVTTFAGHVSEGEFRKNGSSGGMGTWLACELLRERSVDNIVHVHSRISSENDPGLFQYHISKSIDQVQAGAKSRYYPVEMSEAIRHIRENEGSYAIIGIPCFIKAIRLLSLQDPILAKRIKFCIGLVCGQLPTMRFAEMFGWQAGIKPGNLITIDFRKKLDGAPASKFGVNVVGHKDGETIDKTVPFGLSWGSGFFKYNACDYCDDIVGETADVSIGDAWLPGYVSDSRGASIVIIRNERIRELIEQGRKSGRLSLQPVKSSEVVMSQSSGFRHRRDGLAYRLHLADKTGTWHPPKRVKPNDYRFSFFFRKTHEMRMKLAKESHLAFKEARDSGDLSIFWKRMKPLVRHYQMVQAIPFFRKKVKTVLNRLRTRSDYNVSRNAKRNGNNGEVKLTPQVLTVMNHVDSHNLGDAALMYMTASILDKAFSPKKINVLSYNVANDETLIKSLNNDKVQFLSSPTRQSKGDSSSIIVDTISVLAWSVIHRLTGKDLNFISRNRTVVSALGNADLLIIRGGDNLADTYGTISLMKHLYNILLGVILRKRMVILGTTIGPFKKLFTKKLTFWLLRKVEHVVARDKMSVALLQEAGLRAQQIHFIPDVAFDLPSQNDERQNLLLDLQKVKYVGVASSALLANYLGNDKYVAIMAAMCDSIIEKYHVTIILIPHVLTDGVNDLSAAEKIREKMHYKDSVMTIREYNPMIVKYVISKLELLISPRMHPIIHALSQGIPVIGIDYNEKTRELLKLFGKENWVIDFRALDSLVNMVDTFFVALQNSKDFYTIEKIAVVADYVALLQKISSGSNNEHTTRGNSRLASSIQTE